MGPPDKEAGALDDPPTWIDLPIVRGGRGKVWDWAAMKWPSVIPHERRTLSDGSECIFIPKVVFDILDMVQPGVWSTRDAPTRDVCLQCLAGFFAKTAPEEVEAARRLGGRKAMRSLLPWTTAPDPGDEPWGDPPGGIGA